MKILIAEDDVILSKSLQKIIEQSNYTTEIVHNGSDALNHLRTGYYDGVILDINMPKIDSIEVLRILREEGNMTPVLILSGRCEPDDIVLGLDTGANDYMTKPFDMKVLMARLRAMTRKYPGSDTKLSFGNITLDRSSCILSSPAGSLRLANKEFQMMEILLSEPQHLFSTEKLLERIWGYASDAGINVVWVYISRLRKILLTLNADIRIKATRNSGYSLEKK